MSNRCYGFEELEDQWAALGVELTIAVFDLVALDPTAIEVFEPIEMDEVPKQSGITSLGEWHNAQPLPKALPHLAKSFLQDALPIHTAWVFPVGVHN